MKQYLLCFILLITSITYCQVPDPVDMLVDKLSRYQNKLKQYAEKLKEYEKLKADYYKLMTKSNDDELQNNILTNNLKKLNSDLNIAALDLNEYEKNIYDLKNQLQSEIDKNINLSDKIKEINEEFIKINTKHKEEIDQLLNKNYEQDLKIWKFETVLGSWVHSSNIISKNIHIIPANKRGVVKSIHGDTIEKDIHILQFKNVLYNFTIPYNELPFETDCYLLTYIRGILQENLKTEVELVPNKKDNRRQIESYKLKPNINSVFELNLPNKIEYDDFKNYEFLIVEQNKYDENIKNYKRLDKALKNDVLISSTDDEIEIDNTCKKEEILLVDGDLFSIYFYDGGESDTDKIKVFINGIGFLKDEMKLEEIKLEKNSIIYDMMIHQGFRVMATSSGTRKNTICSIGVQVDKNKGKVYYINAGETICFSVKRK